MRHKNLIMTYAGRKTEEMPENVKAQMQSSPELRELLEHQAEVAGLMSLKSYERPDPAIEGRILHRVGVRIKNGDHLQTSSRGELFPHWARMVAVVMVMLGLSVFTHREMLQQNAADAEFSAAIPRPSPEPELFESFEALRTDDAFSPFYVSLAEMDEPPAFMTPEFTTGLETSLLELGLNNTNLTFHSNNLPVFLPAQR